MDASVEIQLLGRTTIRHAGQLIPPFRTAKAHALLLYLLEEQPATHTRDHLMALLWPGLPEKSARDNLRQTLYQLRKALPIPLIESSRQTLRIDPSARFQLDTALLADWHRQLKAQSLDALMGRPDLCERLVEAVERLSDPFAATFALADSNAFEDWLLVTREQYRRQFSGLIELLIAVRLRQNRPIDATMLAELWVDRDPVSEDAYRHLMLAYRAADRRVEALKAYERCRAMMRSQWGVPPSATVEALRDSLAEVPTAQLQPMPQDVAPPVASDPPLLPFVAGPPIMNPAQFFGRTRPLKRITRWLRHQPLTHVALVGERRSGKTSLLHHLRHRIDGIRWVWVDFQDPRMRSLPDLLTYLLTAFGIESDQPPTLSDFTERVLAHHWTQPTVVIMDELAAGLSAPALTQSFWWMLRSIVNAPQTAQLAFVVAAYQNPITLAEAQGKTSPFFNVFSTMPIGRFSEDEARGLIASGGERFTREDVDWILTTSDRWPFLLQICCQERLDALEAGETDGAWQVAASERIEPYRYLLSL